MGRKLIISLCLAVALLLPALPSQASVTLGSDLTGTPFGGTPCPNTTTDPCMLAMTSLPGRMVAAPTDEVIVRWRLKGNSSANAVDVALRVIRPAGGGAFTGVGSSAATFPKTTTDLTISPAAQLPVKAGDLISLAVQPPSNNFVWQTATGQLGLNIVRWQPPLADGSTLAPNLPAQTDTAELLYDADLEPDADCDGKGDETQDPLVSGGCLPAKAARIPSTSVTTKGKTISLSLECPAAGGNCTGNQLSLQSARPVALIAATAKKRRRKQISIGGASFTIPAGGTQTVSVALSGQAKSALRRAGKLAANARITASGASPVTAPLAIKLKKPK